LVSRPEFARGCHEQRCLLHLSLLGGLNGTGPGCQCKPLQGMCWLAILHRMKLGGVWIYEVVCVLASASNIMLRVS